MKETWEEAEIIERRNIVIQRDLEIWRYPKASYEPVNPNQEMVIFDGTQTFTNNLLKGYTFLDDDYIVNDTWKDMMVEIVKILVEKDVNPLLELASSDSGGIDSIFYTEPHEERIEIMPGLYMYAGFSNSNKMKYLMELFDVYKIDHDELTVDIIRE